MSIREEAIEKLTDIMDGDCSGALEDFVSELYEDSVLYNIMCEYGVDNWSGFEMVQKEFEKRKYDNA